MRNVEKLCFNYVFGPRTHNTIADYVDCAEIKKYIKFLCSI